MLQSWSDDRQESGVVLFESETKALEVKSDVFTRTVNRRVVWEVKDGKLRLSVELTEEGGASIGWLRAAPDEFVADVVLAYRVSRVLEAMPRLNSQSVSDVCDKVALALTDALSSMPRLLRSLSKIVFKTIDLGIDDAALQQMLVANPPDLEATLLHLRDLGIPYKTDVLEMEIEAGRIALTPYLRSLGHERLEVLQARSKRLTVQASHYVGHFLHFMVDQEGSHGDHCTCHMEMVQNAVACLERGVTDPSVLVAMSIFLYEQERGRLMTEIRAVRLRGMHLFGLAWLVGMPDGDSPFDAETRTNRIAGWVEVNVSGNAQDIAAEVRRLRAAWKTLPIVVD